VTNELKKRNHIFSIGKIGLSKWKRIQFVDIIDLSLAARSFNDATARYSFVTTINKGRNHYQ